MTDTVDLVARFARYFGPRFKSTNAAIKEIRERRNDGLTQATEESRNLTKTLFGESIDRPLRFTEIDDLVLANPTVRYRLARYEANQEEWRTIDYQTYINEDQRISNLLESLSDAEIEQIRSFYLTTLTNEGHQIIDRLADTDAGFIHEIMKMIGHLYDLDDPCSCGNYLTVGAMAKLERLNPWKIIQIAIHSGKNK